MTRQPLAPAIASIATWFPSVIYSSPQVGSCEFYGQNPMFYREDFR